MNAKKTKPSRNPRLAQDQIDEIVIAESENESAWEKTVLVRRPKPASLSLPGELAARAAFLAKLHRERGVEKWIERIVRERVEIEESAFAEAKRNLGS